MGIKMGEKYKYAKDRVGELYGRLTVESVYREGGRSYAVCNCSCGNSLTCGITALSTGATLSCGCYGRERRSETHTTHGMSTSHTYGCWAAMKSRCDNKNLPHYERYGGSGISYQESWSDFENFYRDMGVCPDDLSLDRIDGTKGYTVDNCRWASSTTQAINRGKFKNNTSGRTGVSFHKNLGKWVARITVNRCRLQLGNYLDIEDAIAAREAAELKYFGFNKE